jgi:hypothetical protein
LLTDLFGNIQTETIARTKRAITTPKTAIVLDLKVQIKWLLPFLTIFEY